MSNQEPDLSRLPDLLHQTADLLRLSGANDFKAGAWDKAAAVVEQEGSALRDRNSEKELQALPGIGKSLAAEIHDFLQTGTLPQFEELKNSLPEGLIDWLQISGLGAKRAAKIHKTLGISTVKELKAALEDGRVEALPGFGKKSAAKILNALTWQEGNRERCLLDEAMQLSENFVSWLRGSELDCKLTPAGSLRRYRETIGDLDFLACMDGDPAPLHERFCTHPDVVEVLARGETKSSVRVRQGRQLDLRTVKPEAYPAALIYFTGSKEHNVFLRSRAKAQGLTLNEYGLSPLDSDCKQEIRLQKEEDVYRELGLPYPPPELREEQYQSWIEQNRIPDLIEPGDLKGVLHAHSTWSDGKNTLEEMARACMKEGYTYLGITDHSQSAFYAGGLKPAEVEAQWKEIDTLNQRFKNEGQDFKIFKGIESDIRADGSLDYDDSLLAGFDFVIASIHGQMDMEAAAMQARVEKALCHPACTILGHPTARLLLQRPGVKLNMERVIRLAAEKNVAIEINAAPPRLELDWRWGKLVKECGLKTAISSDAHEVAQIKRARRFGIPMARKAGYTKKDVLNHMYPSTFANHRESSA